MEIKSINSVCRFIMYLVGSSIFVIFICSQRDMWYWILGVIIFVSTMSCVTEFEMRDDYDEMSIIQISELLTRFTNIIIAVILSACICLYIVLKVFYNADYIYDMEYLNRNEYVSTDGIEESLFEDVLKSSVNIKAGYSYFNMLQSAKNSYMTNEFDIQEPEVYMGNNATIKSFVTEQSRLAKYKYSNEVPDLDVLQQSRVIDIIISTERLLIASFVILILYIVVGICILSFCISRYIYLSSTIKARMESNKRSVIRHITM